MKLPLDQDKSRSLRHLFLRQARPIKDADCLDSVRKINGDQILHFIQKKTQLESFEAQFFSWIGHSKYVQFQKNSQFHVAMCNGITDAFHHFLLTFPKKELVVLAGEYPYHRDYCQSIDRPLLRYTPGSLNSSHIVILSVPFSATGAPHLLMPTLLDECNEKNIPVLLDLAFVGLGATLDLNSYLHHPCIYGLAFSFSKLFFLGKLRIGLYWSRVEQGPLSITKQWNYTNWAGACVAAQLMSDISFDHIADRYRSLQHSLCKEYDLIPSESVLFGLHSTEYAEFHREKTIHRVCLSQAIEHLNKQGRNE